MFENMCAFNPIFQCPIFDKEKCTISGKRVLATMAEQVTLMDYAGAAHLIKELYTGWYVAHTANGGDTLQVTYDDNLKPQALHRQFHARWIKNKPAPKALDGFGLNSEIGFLPYKDNNNKTVYLPVLSIEKDQKDDFYYQKEKIFFQVTNNKLKVKVKEAGVERVFPLSLEDFPPWGGTFSNAFKQFKQEVVDGGEWVDIREFRYANKGCLRDNDYAGNILYFSIIEWVKFQTGSKAAYLIEDFRCQKNQNVDFKQLQNHIFAKHYGQDLYKKTNNKSGFIALEERFDSQKESAYFVANFARNTSDEAIKEMVRQWCCAKKFYQGGLSCAAPVTSNGYKQCGFVAIYKNGEFHRNVFFRKNAESVVVRFTDKIGQNNILDNSIQSVIPTIPNNVLNDRFIKKVPEPDSKNKADKFKQYFDQQSQAKPEKVSMVSLTNPSEKSVRQFIKNSNYFWGYNLGKRGMLVVYNQQAPDDEPKIYLYARKTAFRKKNRAVIYCNRAEDNGDLLYSHYRKTQVEPLIKKIAGKNLAPGKLYSLKKVKPWYKTGKGWLVFFGFMALGAGVGALVAIFAPQIIALLALGALAKLATITAGVIIGAVYFGISFLIGTLSGKICYADREEPRPQVGHKSISKEASQVYINSQITDYDNHNAPEPKIDPNTNNVIDTNDDQLENSGTVHANFGSSNTFIQDNNNNDESLKGKQDISPAPNNNIVFDIE